MDDFLPNQQTWILGSFASTLRNPSVRVTRKKYRNFDNKRASKASRRVSKFYQDAAAPGRKPAVTARSSRFLLRQDFLQRRDGGRNADAAEAFEPIKQ